MYREINTLEDVQRLLVNQIAEDFYIDYKRDLDLEDRKSLLKDVCAFANTYGGQIIYGIAEERGVPTEIVGIKIEDINKEILRISSITSDGLEPVVSGVDITPIKLNDDADKYIIVIKVPKSWCPPHRIKLDRNHKYFGRRSARNDELSYLEIKDHFNMANTLKDSIRKFKEIRIEEIKKNQTPIAMKAGSKIVMHIIPLSAFSSGFVCGVSDIRKLIKLQECYKWFFPMGANIANHEITLDGLLVYPNIQIIHRAYTHIYCEGIVEAVAELYVHDIHGERIITIADIEKYLLAQRYFDILLKLNIAPPYYVFVSLLGVIDCKLQMNTPERGGRVEIEMSNRSYIKDDILFRELILDSSNKSPEEIFKPLLDQVSNAWGFERCMSYSENGDYKK